MTNTSQSLDRGHFSKAHFERFAQFVSETLGIRMPPKKKQMLQARILRRVRRLGLATYEEYYDYVLNTTVWKANCRN